jgi:hypothetical protein
VKPSPYLSEILRLDPVRDHQRIVHLDLCFEFPFDTTRSLELALFRTFAAPRVAALLDASGGFAERAQKRYDDTDLILSTIAEAGYDSTEGCAALRQLNRIHGRFQIENEDFLYVLSTFVYEPMRWNARFGWRPLVEQERLATFHFWREVGRRMNIKEIPDDYAEFERFSVDYERQHFRFTEEGARVARATRAMFLRWFPGLPHALGEPALAAVLDEPLRKAIGFPSPPLALERAVTTALRLRGRVVSLLPHRRRPHLRTRIRHRTYPEGYRVETLGPPERTPMPRGRG